MHEYSLMENIIDSAIVQANKSRISAVKELSLKIGALDIHSVESFEQAFVMLAKGTVLADAILKFTIMPARLECAKCGFKGESKLNAPEDHDPVPVAECPGCGAIVTLIGGKGMQEIEIEG